MVCGKVPIALDGHFQHWQQLYLNSEKRWLPIMVSIDVRIGEIICNFHVGGMGRGELEDFASPQPMGILPTVFVSWNQFRR